jgi:hypothetical protein
MPIPASVQDKRNYAVPEEQAFVLANGEQLRTLDDLSEAINLIDPETFQTHVNAEKNDFANWVEHVFDEVGLAENLRKFPTPLRMMVSIEKFLRQSEMQNPAPEPVAAPAPQQ